MNKKIKNFRYIPDLNICYQSFGKTGNTALLNIFLNILAIQGIPITYTRTVHQTWKHSRRQKVCQFNSLQCKEVFLNKSIAFVISVRNPFTRLLSLYLHITNHGLRGLDQKWQKKLGYEDSLITFNTFLKQLRKIGVENIDGHTFPFSSHSLLQYASYDFMIRLESFQDDVQNLTRSCFNLSVDVPHKGKKTGSNEKIFEFYDSEENISIVRDELYKNDFELLGYSMDINDINKPPAFVQHKEHLTEFYLNKVLPNLV